MLLQLIRILALLALLLPTGAFGWSVGTHVYIAERCLPQYADSDRMRQVSYGCMLPDLVSSYVMMGLEQGPVLRGLCHRESHDQVLGCAGRCPELEAFAAGWCTHNEVWGADRYAHCVSPFDGHTSPGYVVSKTAQLPDVPQSLRHYVVETAIDMLVRRNLDPMLGRKVTEAARNRDCGICGVIAKAYCPPLSAEAVRRAEALYRLTMVAYGDALNLPAPVDRVVAAAIIAHQSTRYGDGSMDVERAMQYLDQAIAVCEPDYRSAIEATIRRVKESAAAQGLACPPPGRPTSSSRAQDVE